MAALRILLCWAPSHPFGWDKMNSMSFSTVFHTEGPVAWVSMIKDRVQRKRYLRKSPNTWTADFDFGR